MIVYDYPTKRFIRTKGQGLNMKSFMEMSKVELQELYETLQKEFEDAKGKGLKKRLRPDCRAIAFRSFAVSSTAPRRHTTGTIGSIASAQAAQAARTRPANIVSFFMPKCLKLCTIRSIKTSYLPWDPPPELPFVALQRQST